MSTPPSDPPPWVLDHPEIQHCLLCGAPRSFIACWTNATWADGKHVYYALCERCAARGSSACHDAELKIEQRERRRILQKAGNN